MLVTVGRRRKPTWPVPFGEPAPMARKVQSSSSQPGGKTFAALLGNAIFWLVVAMVVPVKTFVGSFPELAAFAPWAPLILYGLAALSFVRALFTLRGTLGRVRM